MSKTGLIAGLLWLVLGTAYAQSSLPVAPFTAGYTVYGRGMPLGNGEIRLIDEGNSRYRMQSRLEPEGLAALLISDTISEDVSGIFSGDTPLPHAYRQRYEKKNKERVVQLQFDWQSGQVAASYNDGGELEKAMLPLSPGAVDPLSLHLLVMSNLQRGVQLEQYTMINKTEIKQYAAQYQGGETLQTPLGKLQVLRVSQSRAGSNRETVFWFAVDFNYLPVQIAQYKKGKEQLRMLINNVRTGS